MRATLASALLAVAAIAACAACTGSSTSNGLTAEVKQSRLATIRDVAAQMGVTNGALLGGIAMSETNLAHCWSEATWACQGPASSACDGGPVIAGAADGPCSDQQGGLGMFQFDAGTYAQTLAADGRGILTVEGNAGKAVEFVVGKVIADIPGVTDWLSAVAWINRVPLVAGNPVTEQWAALLACRYNGCCAKSTTCATRAAGYRDNAISVFNAQGAAFWHTADHCDALPADGVIDERSACYLAAGDPQRWRRDAHGYGHGLEWTNATNAAAPASFAMWTIKPGRVGTFRVEVYLDGAVAQAKQATYELAHGGHTDNLVIDQTRAPAGGGFVALGVFTFTGGGDEFVRLADNTGEPTSAQRKLMFDAIRVTPTDGGPGGSGSGGTTQLPATSTGCAAARGGAGVVLFVILIAWTRRRRQTRSR